jgi:hypothetical protein
VGEDASREINQKILLKEERAHVSQNHYSTKPKRRAKSGKRKDPSATTIAKLRQLAGAETKKSS